MTEAEWFDRIQGQVAEGQYFLAFDSYRDAAAAWPDSLRLTLLGALALLRSGAVAEARRLLHSQGARLESGALRTQRIAATFRTAVQAVASEGAGESDLDSALARFLDAIGGLAHPRIDGDEADTPEILRLMSQIQVEIWSRLRDPADLVRALLIAEQAFQCSDLLADGLNAAGIAAMSGDLARTEALATGLRARWSQVVPPDTGDVAEQFRHYAMGGEIALLLGAHEQARDALGRAARLRPRHLPSVVTTLRRIALLESAGVEIPGFVRELLKAPSVAVFAGQSLDAPGCTQPCFPAALEATVAGRIAEELDALGAEIGFSSAGAGAEMLFVEAMLDRGAEVHLYLPFKLDDFVRYRVAYAGGNWERRFRNVCKLATSISFATEEGFLGHDALLRFNNHMIHGMARAQSALNLTDPNLVVLWDYAAASGAGSAADFIDNWPEITRLRLIDLDELRESAGLDVGAAEAGTADAGQAAEVGAASGPAADALPERTIRTMLFADIVGYSKLGEEDLPALWRCLENVKPQLEMPASRLRLIESWGDAIYAVMDNCRDMAEYAFALIDAIARMDASGAGLSRQLQVRVGLHAGPVFEGDHPLTGRRIVYGSHVSRAARIEPVSLPGHVYASQQFVAMLLAEESALRHEATMTGERYRERYACEYLGMLSLAKNYGRQQVYHIRRNEEST